MHARNNVVPLYILLTQFWHKVPRIASLRSHLQIPADSVIFLRRFMKIGRVARVSMPGIMGLQIHLIQTEKGDSGYVRLRDLIRILAPCSRRTPALAQRHDLWPVERTPQAVDQRSWYGPDRGVPARLGGPPGGARCRGTFGIGAAPLSQAVFNLSTTRLLIEMFVRRQDVTLVVRLAAQGRSAQRGDVFAGFSPNSPPAPCHHHRLHEALILGHARGSFGRTPLA